VRRLTSAARSSASGFDAWADNADRYLSDEAIASPRELAAEPGVDRVAVFPHIGASREPAPEPYALFDTQVPSAAERDFVETGSCDDDLPGCESPECPVTAAIARLSEFVDSVRGPQLPLDDPGFPVARPDGGNRFWQFARDSGEPPRPMEEPQLRAELTATSCHPAPGPVAAVKRLGIEVSRIAEIMDARFERAEIVGANQIAALRAEVEQAMAALVARIEVIEIGTAIAVLPAGEPEGQLADPYDLCNFLFENAAPNASDFAAAVPTTNPAPVDQDDCAKFDLTVVGDDRIEFAAVLADRSGAPNTDVEPAAPEATDAVRKQAERNFWQQVRDQLFKTNLDRA